MTSNIRFRVHTDYDYDYDDEDMDDMSDVVIYSSDNDNNSSSVLLTLMSMTTMLAPVLNQYDPNQYDPVEIAIQNSNEDQELRRCSDVKVKIDTQPYNTTEKKFDNCPICTDKYEDTETVSVLNCGHIYHPKCIKEWGHYNPSCPICKAEIPVSRKYIAR